MAVDDELDQAMDETGRNLRMTATMAMGMLEQSARQREARDRDRAEMSRAEQHEAERANSMRAQEAADQYGQVLRRSDFDRASIEQIGSAYAAARSQADRGDTRAMNAAQRIEEHAADKHGIDLRASLERGEWTPTEAAAEGQRQAAQHEDLSQVATAQNTQWRANARDDELLSAWESAERLSADHRWAGLAGDVQRDLEASIKDRFGVDADTLREDVARYDQGVQREPIEPVTLDEAMDDRWRAEASTADLIRARQVMADNAVTPEVEQAHRNIAEEISQRDDHTAQQWQAAARQAEEVHQAAVFDRADAAAQADERADSELSDIERWGAEAAASRQHEQDQQALWWEREQAKATEDRLREQAAEERAEAAHDYTEHRREEGREFDAQERAEERADVANDAAEQGRPVAADQAENDRSQALDERDFRNMREDRAENSWRQNTRDAEGLEAKANRIDRNALADSPASETAKDARNTSAKMFGTSTREGAEQAMEGRVADKAATRRQARNVGRDHDMGR